MQSCALKNNKLYISKYLKWVLTIVSKFKSLKESIWIYSKKRNFTDIFHTISVSTGKSLSEALILGSTNQQYDKRLFIDLPVQYMKTTSSEHLVYTNWFLFWHSEQFLNTTCSPHVLSFLFLCTELVNQWTIICDIVG